jgi:protein arginine kinase
MRTTSVELQSLLPDALPIWFSHSGPDSDLVISTRVRLARNLSNHRFPYHANRAEREKIFTEVAEVLNTRKEFDAFSLINCAAISPLDQQLLLEKRLISPDLLNFEGDRGVAIENSLHTSVMINEEDHIRLHSFDSGFKAEDVWYRINLIDDLLGHYLSYAYEVRRGYLTSCPTNSGTGLRVSFLLHLPGLVLTKTIDPVLLGASQMGISTRSFFGEHSEVVGHLFQLSNQATLGACEEEFLQHTQKIIGEVVTHERTARERILSNAKNELADKIHRAWGILLHARLMTTTEFLNLASAIRMGIDCGIFKELTIEQLNLLTLTIMPAHLQKKLNRRLSEEQQFRKRADILREILSALPEKKRRKKASGTRTLGKSKDTLPK